MAGRSAVAEQSPQPECVPMPLFPSSFGHSRPRGSAETSNVFSSPTATVPALPGSSGDVLRGDPDETISASRNTTARVPSLRPSVVLPRGFLTALHMHGRCLPCRYHKQADGCKVGATCNYCHHAHDDWSLARTQKYFRKHIAEYSEEHGLRGGEP
eukprot:TRINITY_DN4871_c0_g1_i1.p1 TRINITY_DN4871_c0_g1~~TRINITY_DN4871_c0_g1_i1.p1  ORF type:complete len:156 (-),score=18.24 TRINITY_DN4871_c0_g1_i1:597-1064(-)